MSASMNRVVGKGIGYHGVGSSTNNNQNSSNNNHGGAGGYSASNGTSSVPNKTGLGLGISGQSIANKELQAKHLSAITGATNEPKENRGQNPFSSQIQIPLSQKRQGTGQKIIDNNMHKGSMKSYKNLPQSSQGYGGSNG